MPWGTMPAIRQQGDAVVDVHPGKQPQQQGVDADGQGREIDKGDKAVGDAEHRRPDVVAEQRQHIHPAGGVHDAQLRHLLGELQEQLVCQIRQQQADSKAQQDQCAEGDGGDAEGVAVLRVVKSVQPGALLFQPVHHAPSMARPAFRRRSVSSLPRMRQISTAPPGVTSLPAAAMRTGHMRVAFFTSSRCARSTSAS